MDQQISCEAGLSSSSSAPLLGTTTRTRGGTTAVEEGDQELRATVSDSDTEEEGGEEGLLRSALVSNSGGGDNRSRGESMVSFLHDDVDVESSSRHRSVSVPRSTLGGRSTLSPAVQYDIPLLDRMLWGLLLWQRPRFRAKKTSLRRGLECFFAAFAWLPFVVLLVNFLPISALGFHPNELGRFAEFYGLLFCLGVACHQNLSKNYLASGHLEEVMRNSTPESLASIRWAVRKATIWIASTYALPRMLWYPERPYYDLLYDGAPLWLRVVVVMSRVYGDLCILAMAVALVAIVKIIRQQLKEFLEALAECEAESVWDVIREHKEVAAAIDRFSYLTQRWLVVHCILFAVSIFYSALDIYLSYDGDGETVPVDCMVKDVTLYLFVLVVPFFVVSGITADCQGLPAVMAAVSQDELPEIFHRREELHSFIQYLEFSRPAFRIYGVVITRNLSKLSLATGVGSALLSAIRVTNGSA